MIRRGEAGARARRNYFQRVKRTIAVPEVFRTRLCSRLPPAVCLLCLFFSSPPPPPQLHARARARTCVHTGTVGGGTAPVTRVADDAPGRVTARASIASYPDDTGRVCAPVNVRSFVRSFDCPYVRTLVRSRVRFVSNEVCAVVPR